MLARVPILRAYDPRRESMFSYASPSNKIAIMITGLVIDCLGTNNFLVTKTTLLKLTWQQFPCVLGSASHYIRARPGLSFATKRIGTPFCTLFTFVTCYPLQITLSQNYRLPIISVLAENTLLKTACHFLLLLIGFDTLNYRKDYDRSPILVGHQDSFLAPLPESQAPLVSGTW